MAVPVGCWPNANAANSSRPRAFFFFLPRANVLFCFVFWTGPMHVPGPMRSHAAPCGLMRSCGPMHRGSPLGPRARARAQRPRQKSKKAAGSPRPQGHTGGICAAIQKVIQTAGSRSRQPGAMSVYYLGLGPAGVEAMWAHTTLHAAGKAVVATASSLSTSRYGHLC
jgi:hypothetical protein